MMSAFLGHSRPSPLSVNVRNSLTPMMAVQQITWLNGTRMKLRSCETIEVREVKLCIDDKMLALL